MPPSDPNPTLVILAAGRGSRYGGRKQVAAVGPGGLTLPDYAAFDAWRAGFAKVVFVVGPGEEEAMRDAVGGRVASRLPVAYACQRLDDVPAEAAEVAEVAEVAAARSKPWGTAHAVLAAEGSVAGSFAVVNADDFYGAESFAVLARFLRRRPRGREPVFAMVGFTVRQTLPPEGAVSRALCRRDDGGRLLRIVEIAALTRDGDGGRYIGDDGSPRTVDGDELVSMNMWGFGPEIFAQLRRRFGELLRAGALDAEGEFLLPAMIGELIEGDQARVEVLPCDGSWCGLTVAGDRDRVAAVLAARIAAGEYPRDLWSAGSERWPLSSAPAIG
jgi:hypothetical protein